MDVVEIFLWKEVLDKKGSVHSIAFFESCQHKKKEVHTYKVLWKKNMMKDSNIF